MPPAGAHLPHRQVRVGMRRLRGYSDRL